jgi:hypothetical protein
MWLDVTDQMSQQGNIAYTPATGRRDTRFGINAGSRWAAIGAALGTSKQRAYTRRLIQASE